MSKKSSTELTEDIEVIGPGQMLSDARIKLNLSVEEIAGNLNFRVCQVEGIEADRFDKSVPETFIRGYLINYAKLVGVNTRDVLASYDALGIAKQQSAKMQSFSKITEKEAEHFRVMWLSYLIVIVLIALTVVYYFQDENNQKITPAANASNVFNDRENINRKDALLKDGSLSTEQVTGDNVKAEENTSSTPQTNITLQSLANESKTNTATLPLIADEAIESATVEKELPKVNQEQSKDTIDTLLVHRAIFTFAGDCWVNIHDGTGERIAYGIKKSGYVMELNGVPPFEVTVGKPELVAIKFNGQTVDMSKYSSGNIAKFTLPDTPES